MKSKSKTPSLSRTHEVEFPFTRGARVGLFVLLLVTICFAGGVLFVKYQLESFRNEVERDIETRLGARMTMGEVSVNGVRGLRIVDLEVTLPVENGPVIHLTAPTAYIDINLNDLLYGDIIVDRIVLDGASIVVERPADAPWYSAQAPALNESLPVRIKEGEPFRITGENCTLEIRNIVGDTKVRIDPFRFDVARLVDATDLTANLEGDLSNDSNKHIKMKLNLASLEDFELHIQADLITAEDVNIVLPSPQHLVDEGTAQPNVWINGRPDRTLLVTLQMPFQDIRVRDHPEFLEPASGTLTLFATYAVDSHLLSISTAKAESNELNGALDGTILFSEDYPEFDLHLHATQIPVEEILAYLLEGRYEEYGSLDVTLEEPHELEIAMSGTSEQPIFHARARAASGTLAFTPDDEDYPSVKLDLGPMQGTWDSETDNLALAFDIVDGDLYHAPTKLEAHKVSGTVTAVEGVLTMAPFNATVTDNAFVGELRYEIDSGDAEIKIEGTLARIEDTVFADILDNARIYGSAKIKGQAIKQGDRYFLDSEIDFTQARVDYQWWFTKPAGVGASGRVRAEIAPGKSVSLEVDAEVASSDLHATLTMGHTAGKDGEWYLRSVQATSDKLDINGLARCLNLPYRITGGTGTQGHFDYKRDPLDMNKAYQRMGLTIDRLTVLALKEAAEPVSALNLTIESNLETLLDMSPGSLGTITLASSELTVPRIGTTWMIPLDPPPDWPTRERSWNYTIESAVLELPPWKGTDLRANAFSNKSKMGFTSYRVTIDDGRLNGNYIATPEENSYLAKIGWENVPAHYFLEHLRYPAVLTGSVTGEISYSLDQDDPGTLNGEGYFEIRDGEFSTDFLYSILSGPVEEEIGTLPPNLNFDYLYTDIRFREDKVETDNFELKSPIIKIAGGGYYIHDGDLDYRIRLTVDPDTAERIPIMTENFNIQGHRLSNQDIELAFDIKGPTFQPRGELADLPPTRVTLVSGALEVTREAMNIIGIPTKILKDLLKIGGGIVGPGTSD